MVQVFYVFVCDLYVSEIHTTVLQHTDWQVQVAVMGRRIAECGRGSARAGLVGAKTAVTRTSCGQVADKLHRLRRPSPPPQLFNVQFVR